MGLSDFERELAEEQSSKTERSKHHGEDREKARHHRHHHRRRSKRGDGDDASDHRHRSGRDDGLDRDERRRHRHKRRHGEDDDEDEEQQRRHRHKKRHNDSASKARRDADKAGSLHSATSDLEDESDEWVERAPTTLPETHKSDEKPIQRDAWMTAPPTADEIEVVRSRRPKTPPGHFVSAKHDSITGQATGSANNAAEELQRDFLSEGEDEVDQINAENTLPRQHEVDYTFGDKGSSWRMTKLRAVYRQAEEGQRDVDEVALERYGSLRDFDDAREEERELGRRKTLGDEYVGLEKPSGELYRDRLNAMESQRKENQPKTRHDQQGAQQPAAPAGQQQQQTVLSIDELNKMKAQVMKARLRGDPNAATLEAEFKAAQVAAASATSEPNATVVVGTNETRALISNGHKHCAQNEEDMSIADMVREERRQRHAGVRESQDLASRIARDGRFTDSLDYLDENATKLATGKSRSSTSQHDSAQAAARRSHFSQTTCPLCQETSASSSSTTNQAVAPIVSLATRTYLTLSPSPALTPYSSTIVPLQHRASLLHCDDDEWEEMRNFMKSLTAFYTSSLKKSVLFYEDASSPSAHAVLHAVALPPHLAEDSPAFFREALLSAAPAWSTHPPVLDTLKRGGGGRLAFRRALPKEMPYFHVFLTMDGGLAQVIEEDERTKWPRPPGRFAREVLAGMLDLGSEVWRRTPKWRGGGSQEEKRDVEEFRRKWEKWDWTKALVDADC